MTISQVAGAPQVNPLLTSTVDRRKSLHLQSGNHEALRSHHIHKFNNTNTNSVYDTYDHDNNDADDISSTTATVFQNANNNNNEKKASWMSGQQEVTHNDDETLEIHVNKKAAKGNIGSRVALFETLYETGEVADEIKRKAIEEVYKRRLSVYTQRQKQRQEEQQLQTQINITSQEEEHNAYNN